MKRMTIKQEALFHLQRQGHTATDQDIQRAIWRERKQRSGTVSGQSIASYLMFNKIALRSKRATTTVQLESDVARYEQQRQLVRKRFNAIKRQYTQR